HSTQNSPLFPYTTLFRSGLSTTNADATCAGSARGAIVRAKKGGWGQPFLSGRLTHAVQEALPAYGHRQFLCGCRSVSRHRLGDRSEEHTSELQSRFDLVC